MDGCNSTSGTKSSQSPEEKVALMEATACAGCMMSKQGAVSVCWEKKSSDETTAKANHNGDDSHRGAEISCMISGGTSPVVCLQITHLLSPSKCLVLIWSLPWTVFVTQFGRDTYFYPLIV